MCIVGDDSVAPLRLFLSGGPSRGAEGLPLTLHSGIILGVTQTIQVAGDQRYTP